MDEAWTALSTFQARSVATAGNRDSALERELVRDFIAQVPIPAIFQCLQAASDAGETKQVKLVCQCLERIFRSPLGADILFQEEMGPFLLAGVSHTELSARKLTLDMLDHQLLPQFHDRVSDEALLHAVCSCILDDDPGVARKASDLLFKLVSLPATGIYHAILRLLSELLQEHLPVLSRGNSVEYVRLLETIAKLASVDDDVMHESFGRGLLQPILDGVQSKDALFQLNILDIIPVLCNTKAGLVLVFQSDVLTHLIRTVQDPLIGGAALRLIGQFSTKAAAIGVSSWNWADASLSKAFLAAIEYSFQVGDALQKIAAMDAAAAFASASENELGLLLQHKTLIALFLESAHSTVLEVKSNCFMALATILARPTTLSTTVVPDETATIWTLHQSLFRALGGGRPSTMHLLMDCLRQPFDAIRIAVYTLLQAVVAQGHPWGLQTLLAYGGFVEYLLDRSTEPTKTTREWKFALVDGILASPHKALLGKQQRTDLDTFFALGPYAGQARRQELLLESA
ncbi:hypothetical protein SDRG_17098 [Saprolegnia diclina VS20]|uniref:26S proteasome non-ATPase regulatory subunit 5 n=1 Tax=Saprolegnia diclina (strain VS20) TaxID=1156394 RepID=T0PS27_SAPDV|nr:hypothetical protein SDRG_17098 [Saprolegnia diclina VS20]EQC25021.1 hypothetical protein SDRG_17098 [Saprolegnia diclina VS20]|eukprot:XP_008621555.1 hypothetical protein SDRG_17098 [Saprolegnia diclina VS20]